MEIQLNKITRVFFFLFELMRFSLRKEKRWHPQRLVQVARPPQTPDASVPLQAPRRLLAPDGRARECLRQTTPGHGEPGPSRRHAPGVLLDP